ncbi:phosphopyruvate hydratase [Candidatus Kuenenbacteria bacterium HGW-Kuenenbacteria-1]|uniref:Enolase n=1 Tax=Candidatus Kuenenbacteria bacterium HGW-Kuenenbacteria-1 TaxID=2013812 RepID=A0A2N1UNL5_9BACT|nr:MAG: phosphopyruvate hydratase [Candidatus Kuenenbacteria bacterium HGW-Kuenenbacteria-1]
MNKSSKIKNIYAREILDSRGDPTIETMIELENGISTKASVPSGASTGIYEAMELRDNNSKRYDGKGILNACKNVNTKIAQALKGMDVTQQQKIDQKMIDLDKTENKSNLGANAILSVSLACARLASKSQNIELYKYISSNFQFSTFNFQLPVPMFNILNGGKHADTNLDFQEFMIIPARKEFKEMVRVGAEIFYQLKNVLSKKGYNTNVGNEGGYAPNINSNKEAIELILEAIKKTKYKSDKDIFLGLDVAASEFYNKEKNKYILKADNLILSCEELINLYLDLTKKYPIISIEDPLEQNDWEGWIQINSKFNPPADGQNSKLLIVGDDFFVTNTKRLQKGIEQGCANAILIKLNQIGTLTETINCIKLAQKNNYKVIISHRSGETCDDFIADLAVAVSADYIKAGSLSRGERVCKYNRLMEIENQLKINYLPI